VESYCVTIPARELGPAILHKRAGSNYGKLDESSATQLLHRSLGAHARASPTVEWMLALPDGSVWEPAAESGVCARASGGMLAYAWVSVKEPGWVGDDLELVLHVCSAADAEHLAPWWRTLAMPRRYAALCTLESCAAKLRRASRTPLASQ
jgi:hypothetical protein